jgi:hypothetical protein
MGKKSEEVQQKIRSQFKGKDGRNFVEDLIEREEAQQRQKKD